MSTLVEDAMALLSTLTPAGGVWYAVNTMEAPVFPYIVFQRVASTPNVALSGQSAMQNTRFQIDIYSRRQSEAVAIETALETAMTAWSVQNVPLQSQDLNEPDVRAFRISKDYSVWATN